MNELKLTQTWTATDGLTFDDESDAEQHQALLNVIQTWMEAESIPATRHNLMRDRILSWVRFCNAPDFANVGNVVSIAKPST